MRIQSLRGALFCVGILVSVAQPDAGQVSEGADAIIAGAYAHAIALLPPRSPRIRRTWRCGVFWPPRCI